MFAGGELTTEFIASGAILEANRGVREANGAPLIVNLILNQPRESFDAIPERRELAKGIAAQSLLELR